jgi:hypothetical protein
MLLIFAQGVAGFRDTVKKIFVWMRQVMISKFIQGVSQFNETQTMH